MINQHQVGMTNLKNQHHAWKQHNETTQSHAHITDMQNPYHTYKTNVKHEHLMDKNNLNELHPVDTQNLANQGQVRMNNLKPIPGGQEQS